MVVSTAEQLAEYMAAVTDATLGSGVAAQMGAFREGFNEVFSLRYKLHGGAVRVQACRTSSGVIVLAAITGGVDHRGHEVARQPSAERSLTAKLLCVCLCTRDSQHAVHL